MILGIDVGGTHTDAVLIENLQLRNKAKVITDNSNIMASLLAVVQEAISNININDIKRIVLSTTISTNAIVQGKTDRVGMILQSGPGLSPSALDTGNDFFFVQGYVNHRGIIVQSPDEDEIKEIGNYFLRENIENIGVVGKFSTRNPQNEITVAQLLNNDKRHFSLGHRLSGHLNFPRRISTTYLNACISRIYENFVQEVKLFLQKMDINVPIYILKADGGTILIDQSLSHCAQTIHSGPAASIMGVLASSNIREDAVALDIGGTTTDISVFVNGMPLFEASGVTIGNRKTLIRGLFTKSIGVGGDSKVEAKNGRISVGPLREGPAAALGGKHPTLTDAIIVQGLANFGNPQKSFDALEPLAKQLNTDVASAAKLVVDMANEQIASHVLQVLAEINNKPVYTIHELLGGKTIRPQFVHVVGGPAKALAPGIAAHLGCSYQIPDHPEVANAIGAALARTTTEVTILADTEKEELQISEEGFHKRINSKFSAANAIAAGKEVLRQRASKMGANMDELEIEVEELQEFNMVRDFYTTGKNIRAKMQIKPGIISPVETR